MDNLIDGIRKVLREESIRQLAEFETYTIGNSLKHIKNKIINTARLLFKKKVDKVCSPDSLSESFNSAVNEYKGYSNKELVKKICTQLKNKIKVASFVKIKNENSEDELSAATTKSVRSLLNPFKIKGFSVTELNDYIFKNYRISKLDRSSVRMTLWGVGCIILLLLLPVTLFLTEFPVKWCLLSDLFLIVLYTWFMARRNAKRQLIHFIWLAASGIEKGFVKNESLMPSRKMDVENSNKLNLEIRAIHTINNSIHHTQQEILELENRIRKAQSDIDSNNNKIRKAGQNPDDKRFADDKSKENSELAKKIKAYKNQIDSKRIQVEDICKIAYDMEENVSSKIKSLWSKEYSKLEFSKIMLTKLMRDFCYDDLAFAEQRLFELNETDAPLAISKPLGDKYTINFHTAQGDIAILEFAMKDNKIVFGDISRKKPIKNETPVTYSELSRLFEAKTAVSNKDAELLHEQLLKEQQRWEKERSKLEEKANSLEDTINTVTNDVLAKQSEIEKLSKEMSRKEEECDNLRKLIEEYEKFGNTDNSEYFNLLKKYKEKEHELSLCRENEERLNKELEQAFSDIESYIQQVEICQKEADSLEEKFKAEFEKAKTEFERLIEEKNNDINKQQNNINIYKTIVERAEASQKADKKVIATLMQTTEELKESNDSLVRERNMIRSDMEKAEEKYKNKLKDLKKSLKEKTYEPLYDVEIYDRLYEMIREVKHDLYIVCPFVTSKNMYKKSVDKYTSIFTNNKNAFLEVHKTNPKTKFHILYGIQDQKNNPRFIEAKNSINEYKQFLGDSLDDRIGNTHTKLVIVDDTCFMMGSANIMSFSGAYRKCEDLHSELMLFSNDKEMIKKLKKHYFQ